MIDNYFLGIQYNWRDGENYPLQKKLQKAISNRIKVESDHILIQYPDDHAPGGQNRKLLDKTIPEALPVSDYSNIYVRMLLPAGQGQLLRKSGKLNIPTISNPTDLAANFANAGADADILSVLTTDPRYPYYNELFQQVARVAQATGMLHTLELELEDKEEWGTEEDQVFVSCMLEDG